VSIWDWYYVWEALPYLYRGAVVTVQATLIGFAIALVLGLVFALIRQSNSRLVNHAMAETVEFIRSTPLLLQIFFVYFVGPQFGIVIPAWIAGIGMLGIHYAAYCSEVYRAGIEAVEGGQWEASIALNLSRARTWRVIILPQAIRRILPALGNQLVYMLKMSSLVSVIGMQELTRKANELVVSQYRPLEIYTILVLEYLVLILIVSAGVRWLERRLKTDERN